MARAKIAGTVQVRVYDVMNRCVEEGISLGWLCAHRHTNKPSDEVILEQMQVAVMNAICEFFDFTDSEGEGT